MDGINRDVCMYVYIERERKREMMYTRVGGQGGGGEKVRYVN